MINKKLKNYIEKEILSQYDENNGHGKSHIESVIKRSFELNDKFNLHLDSNMIYVIAAYHDLGYKIDADNHEEVSSNLFMQDNMMKTFFSDEDRKIIKEAITDHRASLEYEPRSIYGKLISSADREINVKKYLKRSIFFQANKHKNENTTVDAVINYSYKKISSKYGKEGYAKMYYPDETYKNYLKEIQMLINDRNSFMQTELEIIRNEFHNKKIDLNNYFYEN